MTVGYTSVVIEYIRRKAPVIPNLPMIANATPADVNAETINLLTKKDKYCC